MTELLHENYPSGQINYASSNAQPFSNLINSKMVKGILRLGRWICLCANMFMVNIERLLPVRVRTYVQRYILKIHALEIDLEIFITYSWNFRLSI